MSLLKNPAIHKIKKDQIIAHNLKKAKKLVLVLFILVAIYWLLKIIYGSDEKLIVPSILSKRSEQGDNLQYYITTPEYYSKSKLIEIAWHYKKYKDPTWEGKFVMFFYYKCYRDENVPYASANYLPKCHDCMKDIDNDGKPIEYRSLNQNILDFNTCP